MPNLCNKKADTLAGKASFLHRLSAGGPRGVSLHWAREGDLSRHLRGCVAFCILDVGLASCSRGVEIISSLKQKPPIC